MNLFLMKIALKRLVRHFITLIIVLKICLKDSALQLHRYTRTGLILETNGLNHIIMRLLTTRQNREYIFIVD